MVLNNLGTVKLETERLILRRFEIGDTAGVFKNWISNPNVQNNYGEKAYDDISEVGEILEKWIESYKNNDFYRWTIVLKDTNENIEQIAFYLVDSKNQKVDVEYCIGEHYWGNGYMPEALKSVISYGLTSVGFNRVQAFHRSKNASSGKVLQKAGMKYEGTMKQYLIHKDSFDDCIFYAITRNELYY